MPSNMNKRVQFLGEVVTGYDLVDLKPGCVLRFDTGGPSYYLTGVSGMTATSNTVTGMSISSTGATTQLSEAFWSSAANPGVVGVSRMLRLGASVLVRASAGREARILETQPVTNITVLRP